MKYLIHVRAQMCSYGTSYELFFFFFFCLWHGSDTEQAWCRLSVFALAVVCIGASGTEAQAWVPMAARTLAGHTTQTSSRD